MPSPKQVRARGAEVAHKASVEDQRDLAIVETVCGLLGMFESGGRPADRGRRAMAPEAGDVLLRRQGRGAVRLRRS